MLDSLACSDDDEMSKDDVPEKDDDDEESGNGGACGIPKKAYGVSIHATRMRRTEHSVSSDDCEKRINK